MIEESSLIGLTITEAKEKLKENKITEIEVVDNFKENDRCNTKIVCSVKIDDNKCRLICGEFCLGVKGEVYDNKKSD